MALLALALLASGCGSAKVDPKHPDYEKELAGSPPALAALHDEANELLPGGIDAYEKRIASLRGYPIVVNNWASWCGPCRFEFPAFQELSAKYGKRVAFLGVDSDDSVKFASDFLEEAPVPYPSYSDPDLEIKKSLDDPRGYPNTAYYNPQGELVYVKQGQYPDEAAIEADIERCALANECESG